jgi:hypothetical protein
MNGCHRWAFTHSSRRAERHLSCHCRWAVFFVFPTFMGPIKAIRCVILFKRGAVADKLVSRRLCPEPRWAQSCAPPGLQRCTLSRAAVQTFNSWIDEQFESSPQTAIAVYPEGGA